MVTEASTGLGSNQHISDWPNEFLCTGTIYSPCKGHTATRVTNKMRKERSGPLSKVSHLPSTLSQSSLPLVKDQTNQTPPLAGRHRETSPLRVGSLLVKKHHISRVASLKQTTVEMRPLLYSGWGKPQPQGSGIGQVPDISPSCFLPKRRAHYRAEARMAAGPALPGVFRKYRWWA